MVSLYLSAPGLRLLAGTGSRKTSRKCSPAWRPTLKRKTSPPEELDRKLHDVTKRAPLQNRIEP